MTPAAAGRTLVAVTVCPNPARGELMNTSIETNRDRLPVAAAATAAVIGAAAWVALAADSILRPDPRAYRDALVLVPWILFAATLACVHKLQRDRGGTGERWGYRVVMVAMALVVVGNIAVVLGVDGLQLLGFPLGALGFLVGMVAFGAGTVRANVFPRRVGWSIALAQFLTVAASTALSPLAALPDDGYGSYTGGVAHGVVMLVINASLRQHRRTGEPARDESLAGT